MGRTADRLPVFSSTGPEPEFNLNDTQVPDLEKVIGSSLSSEARESLTTICRRYLTFRQAELGAGMKSDAEKVWSEARSRISRFVELAEGAYPQHSDAGEVVTGAIFEGLSRVSIQLTERDLEPVGLDASLSKGSKPLKGAQLNLTSDFMMRLAGALRIAMTDAERSLNDLGGGFKPGQAFTSWLIELRDWAKANNLPHGAASKGVGELSPFPRFLYCLHGFLPKDIRDSVNSDDAMNERLSRVIYDGANTK